MHFTFTLNSVPVNEYFKNNSLKETKCKADEIRSLKTFILIKKTWFCSEQSHLSETIKRNVFPFYWINGFSFSFDFVFGSFLQQPKQENFNIYWYLLNIFQMFSLRKHRGLARLGSASIWSQAGGCKNCPINSRKWLDSKKTE